MFTNQYTAYCLRVICIYRVYIHSPVPPLLLLYTLENNNRKRVVLTYTFLCQT